MTDLTREKYQRLMARIDALEERFEDLRNQLSGDVVSGDRSSARLSARFAGR